MDWLKVSLLLGLLYLGQCESRPGRTCPEYNHLVGQWVPAGDKCFFIHHMPHTFSEGLAFCESLNATLGSIESEEEIEALKDHDHWSHWASMGYNLWLGAVSCPLSDRKYRWLDGSEFNFTNWDESAEGKCPLFYPCRIGMRMSGDQTWAPRRAGEHLYPLCQLNLKEPHDPKAVDSVDQIHIRSKHGSDSTYKCPVEWYQIGRKCVTLYTRRGTFEENRKLCHDNNSTMITIESEEENGFLTEVATVLYNLPPSCCKVWLSGRGVHSRSEPYRWGDGSSLGYSNWAKYFPSCHQPACGITFGPLGDWKDEDLEDRYIQGCQMKF